MQRPTRDELIALAKADPEAIADLVLMLWDRIEALEKRIAELERNSRTSSKPPSTDKANFTNPPKPKPKSLRQKSKRKTGGQKGHPGSTLEQVATPNHLTIHDFLPDAACPDCGTRLAQNNDKNDEWEVRQVFDFPPIELEVTEHRARRGQCPDCGKRVTADFPDEVKAPVQYGSRIQATALYLGGYQLLPYRRLSELFGELFNVPLSEGTLANIVKRGSQKAALAMEPVREALVQSPVAHADETGCTLHGQRHWLHVFGTEKLTAYHFDAKRGVEAMKRMELIPRYQGVLIHDGLPAYFTFTNCEHGLCNAHLLRELTYLFEELDQSWAAVMIELLLKAKDLAEREEMREAGSRRVIGEGRVKKMLKRYEEILTFGYAENPEPPPKAKGQRGRVARGKSLNLLDRFAKYRDEILGFFLHPGHYPFDNNLSERDVRMMKVREKVSGTFRSEEHAKGFCNIRSIISSARKQGRTMLATLGELINRPTTLGTSLAEGS